MIDTNPKEDTCVQSEEDALYEELFRLHSEVHVLAEDLDRLDHLLEIQRSLVSAILRTETEIKSAKDSGDDPKDWQYLRYNFLCLGDSLAFLYLDRFSLKQTYFNVENYSPKQGGGFLSGQTGLAGEIAVLEQAIEAGVPAVLCDLTNVVRYGDVCLLGAADPFPIEVKSSKTKDKRGKRQKRKLAKLLEFLESDRAQGFRGNSKTTVRIETSLPLNSYSEQLEAAIQDAESEGMVTFDVDECLRVAVFQGAERDMSRLMDGIDGDRALGNFVNDIKSNMLWAYHYPYALSFKHTKNYAKFVHGEVVIVTILDMGKFESKLAYDGIELKVEADENSIQCRIKHPELSDYTEEPWFYVSDGMMARIWTDFLNPSWIVQNAIEMLDRSLNSLGDFTDGVDDADAH
ncbi:hypothetical protein [Ruegeria sp. HKCCA4008]|uniref:hypothetical protein n=1 Tax=Ruegeria sp. HKCCA4008 TaxID=2682999 RepID=UPI00148831B8|nr:hypothetical protein [Ruegeria sp. HKCCA4008]